MNAVSLTLPYPPATNNLFFNRKGGGRAKSARYTSWRTEALWEAKRQHAGRVDGPYALTIIACRPVRQQKSFKRLIRLPIKDLPEAVTLTFTPTANFAKAAFPRSSG